MSCIHYGAVNKGTTDYLEVIVELKVADILGRLHRAQCLNCLRASGKRLALLLNLGRPKVDVERVISGY